jgi:hypothetical protein
MASKPIDLPPVVARAFIKDMRASFAENDAIKRDEIAARQLRALRDYNPPRAKSGYPTSSRVSPAAPAASGAPRCGRISTGIGRPLRSWAIADLEGKEIATRFTAALEPRAKPGHVYE